MSGATNRIAIALLVTLLAVNVYRARNQSITCDEARTFHDYLNGSPSKILRNYDANNHILYTILARISLRFFGRSEFSLRLPSLIGCLLYFWGVYRLCRYIFGDRWLFLLAAGVLTLNPYILDFLSAARGYGLALALWVWGFYHITRYLSEWNERYLYRAGVLFGLSVAANLTLTFPAAGCGLTLMAIVVADGLWQQVFDIIHRLWVPAIVTGFVILILPLGQATAGSFYFGAASLDQTVWSLVALSFTHHQSRFTNYMQSIGIQQVMFGLVVVILVALAIVLMTLIYKWSRSGSFQSLEAIDKFLLLLGGTMAGALALVIAAHTFAHVPYPCLRSGLYWIVLFALGCVALSTKLQSWHPALSLPLLLIVGGSVLYFALEWNTTVYGEWTFDAYSKHIVGLIRARESARRSGRVCINASWPMTPALNFYRVKYHLDWLEEVARKDPSAESPCEYFVLRGGDDGLIDKLHLTPIYRSPYSEATLAIATPSTPE